MNELVRWVREEVEPYGCRVCSDDGVTVLRDAYSDGYVITVLCNDFLYGFLTVDRQQVTNEQAVRRDARELGKTLDSFFREEGYEETDAHAGQSG